MKCWSDSSRVIEMNDHLTPISQVLKRLNEENESLARQLQFRQGGFIKNEDDGQRRMGQERRIRSLPPPLSAWTATRDLPEPPPATFRDSWQQEGRP